MSVTLYDLTCVICYKEFKNSNSNVMTCDKWCKASLYNRTHGVDQFSLEKRVLEKFNKVYGAYTKGTKIDSKTMTIRTYFKSSDLLPPKTFSGYRVVILK